jgi:hypothetical protein
MKHLSGITTMLLHIPTQTQTQLTQAEQAAQVERAAQAEREAQEERAAQEVLEARAVLEAQAEQALAALVKEVARAEEEQSLSLPIQLLLQSLTILVRD